MKIIRPVAFTDDVVTSVSIAEDDKPAWGSGTTYAAGVEVIRGHFIWKSVQASNVGHDPLTSPTWWSKGRATNAWSMFDEKVGTLSTATGSITVVLEPGAVDSLAILDADAASAELVIRVAGEEVYRTTRSTNVGGKSINSWSLWFFEPIGRKSTLLFLGLPKFPNGEITVTINAKNPATAVSAGTMVVGRIFDIGRTGANVKVGIDDFSKITEDDFGAISIVERGWRKRMTAQTMVLSSRVDDIQRVLAAYRAKPVLWIGQEGFDSLTIYGLYGSYETNIAYADGVSFNSLNVRGLSTSN